MRIVGGAWRGRRLVAPPGRLTRPTSDRTRQALFDMLLHAPWADADALEGASVLDVFAGTGALGLEALSRGAASATFIEREPAALRALRMNVAACGAERQCLVLEGDALDPPVGSPHRLVFFDPPYGRDVAAAVDCLEARGWIGPGSLIVAETAHDEAILHCPPLLAERLYGAARIRIWRVGSRA